MLWLLTSSTLNPTTNRVMFFNFSYKINTIFMVDISYIYNFDNGTNDSLKLIDN